MSNEPISPNKTKENIDFYKKLLTNINLESILGYNLDPLIIGHLKEVFKGEYSRPLIFAYRDATDVIKLIKIEENDANDRNVCSVFCKVTSIKECVTNGRNVCSTLNKVTSRGEELCDTSNEGAFDKLIKCKTISEMDKYHVRIDSNPNHIGYRYNCSVMGLMEWIIPLFINDICVGAFISGRFYNGDQEKWAENIHSALLKNHPDEASKFTVDIIKEKCEMPKPEPDDVEKDRLFKRVAKMQECMQNDYDNELARREKLVLGHLISIIDGNESKKTNIPESITERFEYSRELLNDSLEVIRDIFNFSECVVFTNDIQQNIKPPYISGIQLNGVDGNKNPVQTGSKQRLSVEKIEREIDKSTDKGLFAHLTFHDRECREFFVDYESSNSERFENCLLMIVVARRITNCPIAFFISLSNKTDKKNAERAISFLEHLSTAFLAQWNMLLAEQRKEDATSNIMYIRHEVREALSAQDGILRKLEILYRQTSEPGARSTKHSYPELPPKVADFLDYMQSFIGDYSAAIQMHHDIIDNYNILAEDLVLTYVDSYSINKQLNAIPPVFKHMGEFSNRWIIKSIGWEVPNPQLIDVDPGKISQAIRNLVRNAQKYGYDSTSVLLDYGWDKDNMENVFFTVTSFGAEIPEDEHDRIFERGYRGRRHSGEKEYGRGLGLYVARKIAELHGGTVILVESKKESNLNIPLLFEYKKKYETKDKAWLIKKGFNETTYDLCIEALKEIKKDILKQIIYRSDKNQEQRQSSETAKEHGPRYIVNKIIEPTYRNTFKITIPRRKRGK